MQRKIERDALFEARQMQREWLVHEEHRTQQMQFQVERRCSSSFLLLFRCFFFSYLFYFISTTVRSLAGSVLRSFPIFSFVCCRCYSLFCFDGTNFIKYFYFTVNLFGILFYRVAGVPLSLFAFFIMLFFLLLELAFSLHSVSLSSVECLTSTQAAFWRPLIVQNYVYIVLYNRNTHRLSDIGMCALFTCREYENIYPYLNNAERTNIYLGANCAPGPVNHTHMHIRRFDFGFDFGGRRRRLRRRSSVHNSCP